jgi:threonine aldolase
MRTFASDNYAGVLPEIISALAKEALSKTHARAYGNDGITQEVRLLIKQIFNSSSNDPLPGVYFVFNGTGANILSILACTHSYHAVICSDISHIICDESSSPETVTGVRLISIPTNENGKIDINIIEEKLDRIGDMHAAQPKMLTIAQPTEYGTVYTIDELKQLSQLAKKYNLYFRKFIYDYKTKFSFRNYRY